jgi:indole-3-glycerol phosphate synthase
MYLRQREYDNAKAQKTFRAFKSALTRALNHKGHAEIIAECKRFRDYYRNSAEPLPDDWARWQRAADVSYFALMREGKHAERIEI